MSQTVDYTTQYVCKGVLNELAVSGTATPISIASGEAWVYGAWYQNDAATTQAVSTPATNPRIDRLILRYDSTAQTVRIALLAGTAAASPVPPTLTQTASTFEVSLAQVAITTGGVITVTSERGFITDPGAAGAVDASTLDYDTSAKKIRIAPTGSPTVAGLTVSRSLSGGTTQEIIRNTSNTASSAAQLQISTAGASGDDPYIDFNISGVADWTVGLDNSDSDKFKISAGATLGTTDIITATASGDVTIGGANTTTTKSSSGATVTTTTANTSNTASSNARNLIQVAGTSANDAFTQYQVVGTTDWSTGVDNSDSDKYKISASSALGTSDAVAVDTSGNMVVTGNVNAVNVTASSALTGATGSFSGNVSSSAGTFSGAGLAASASSSGGSVITSTTNTSNTANSNARVTASVAGSSAGDPYILYDVSGVQNWTEGVDNSDSDKFKISASSALGTSDVLTLTTAGAATLSSSLTVANGFTVSAGTVSAPTVPILANRQGGSASDWATAGTSSQTPVNSRKVVGAISISWSGSVIYGTVVSTTVVTLPITYTGTPIVILTMGPTSASNIAGQYLVTASAVTTNTFTISLWTLQTTTAGASSATVYWETTGPI